MNNHRNKTAIFLMGPTASGKSQVSLALANKLPIEIISVDSAAIYQGLNIGTSKPSNMQRRYVPHHLIDIIPPTNSFSVAEFCQVAPTIMADIHQRGKIPVLVGGTMLYFYTLEHGLSDLPPADLALRRELTMKANRFGIAALHQMLQQLDAQAATTIKANDSQRIIRALEVSINTGQPYSKMSQPIPCLTDWQITHFVMSVPREILRIKISHRLKQMLESGWIDEVSHLRTKYNLDESMASMRTVGYKQILQYLNGELLEHEVEEKIFFATCQLAKRQRTWLNKWPHAKKITDNLEQALDSIVKAMLD